MENEKILLAINSEIQELRRNIGFDIFSINHITVIVSTTISSMLIFLWFGILGINTNIQNIIPFSLDSFESFILIYVSLFLITLLFFYGLYCYRKYIFSIPENILNLHDEIQKNLEQQQTLEEILKKTQQAYWLTKKIISYKLLLLIFMKKGIYDSYIYLLGLENKWCITIFNDLRSDLQIRMQEQQSSLESAKSEVEKNIVGTTELNQVSELQRARLDRQIEQFEELQRVLVKV